jgi:hypothetical protein
MTTVSQGYRLFISLFGSIIKTILAVGQFNLSPYSLTTRAGYTHLLNLFTLTGGVSNTIISIILRKRKYPIKKIGILDTSKQGVNQDKDKQLINMLRADGYVIVDDALNQADVRDILSFAKTTLGTAHRMDLEPDAQPELQYFLPDIPKATKFSFPPDSILRNRTIQKLIADESFLELAQSYLGGCPIIDDVQLWWSTAYKELPDIEAAQYWHFDMNRPKWVKFFFYITDVTSETGPHCFIRGTHIDRGIPWSLRKFGYTRLEDQQILATFEHANILEFTGVAGKLIIEDTRGLHKAKNLVHGNRLIFEITYCSSLYGGAFNNIEIPEDAETILIDQIKKMPKVYQVFRIPPTAK